MFGFKRLKMVQFLLCGAILLIVHTSAGAASLAYIPIDRRGTWDISLNGEWRFMLNGPEEEFFKPEFDVSGWSTIKVPDNWEVQGSEEEEPLYKEPAEGVGLYRRLFEAPVAWKDRRVFIRFEGVLYGFEFWINGNKTGGMMTLLPVKAAQIKSEKGSMRLVPLEAGTWPALFEDVLRPGR